MTAALWMAMVCGHVGGVPMAQVHCDVLEVNTLYTYDWQGKPEPSLRQLILWHIHKGEYHVDSWDMVGSDERFPTSNPWIVRHGGVLIKIYYDVKFVTHTNYDPESADRDAWPTELRRNSLRQWSHIIKNWKKHD